MLVWINDKREVIACNEIIVFDEAQKNISQNCFWVEGAINKPHCGDDQVAKMYLNDDNTIRYEIVGIEPLPPHPPTDQEKILIALAQQKEENLTIMMAQADAYEAEQANSLTIMLALADLYEMGGVE